MASDGFWCEFSRDVTALRTLLSVGKGWGENYDAIQRMSIDL